MTGGEGDREALTDDECEVLSAFAIAGGDVAAYGRSAALVAVVERILADRRTGEGDLRALLTALAAGWEGHDPTGTMPNVRRQELCRCAADLRTVLAAHKGRDQ